jgi:hypothetical protein
MLLKEVIKAFELVDHPQASGEKVAAELRRIDPEAGIEVKTIKGNRGSTDFIKLLVKGSGGPTLGIIGRLGGVGARPKLVGAVSDADGAIVAIACGLKLVEMHKKGDILMGDVIITTHICPKAPTLPHDPVPFMGSPVDMQTMNRFEVDERMDAILSVDATKGNEIINHSGFAISPTVKEGYILRVSEDLIRIMRIVTGRPPVTFPITTQDITPYGNGLYHLNSIMQPSTVTESPVVGVATTAEELIPGCGTGANYPLALEAAARFCVEVAKEFGQNNCKFYDKGEFQRLINLYGSMKKLQTTGEGGDI